MRCSRHTMPHNRSRLLRGCFDCTLQTQLLQTIARLPSRGCTYLKGRLSKNCSV